MDRDFYTREGVLAMRLRIAEAVKALAVEKGVQLDPDGLVFFDGSMNLPEQGAPWKVTLHSRGKSETIVLSADDLADFRAGRLSMVPTRIGMALNKLSGT